MMLFINNLAKLWFSSTCFNATFFFNRPSCHSPFNFMQFDYYSHYSCSNQCVVCGVEAATRTELCHEHERRLVFFFPLHADPKYYRFIRKWQPRTSCCLWAGTKSLVWECRREERRWGDKKCKTSLMSESHFMQKSAADFFFFNKTTNWSQPKRRKMKSFFNFFALYMMQSFHLWCGSQFSPFVMMNLNHHLHLRDSPSSPVPILSQEIEKKCRILKQTRFIFIILQLDCSGNNPKSQGVRARVLVCVYEPAVTCGPSFFLLLLYF